MIYILQVKLNYKKIIKRIQNKKEYKMTLNECTWRLIQITYFIDKQKSIHAYNQHHKFVNYRGRPYNQKMRKNGSLKQPGGSSCNQRR